MKRRIVIAAALLAGAPLHAEWYEAAGQHFVVYADDSPANITAYATRLETFDKAIRVLRNVPDAARGAASRVTVYRWGDGEWIKRLFGDPNVAGFYIPRASGAVAFVPKSSTDELNATGVLLHEYAHHFMYNDWPNAIYPKWFSEGFAEFHRTAGFEPDGSIIFGAPPLDRRWGVAAMNQMPVSLMVRGDTSRLSDVETYYLYSRGWGLTHMLTFDPDLRKQLGAYVGAISSGQSSQDAAKAFGNLDALDIKLNNYLQRAHLPSARISADKLTIRPITLRKLTPGEAATMVARMRSQRGVDDKQAGEVAQQARTAAAPYPNDAAAQNELAEADFDAKDYGGAEAAADRALAADPTSVHALAYKGLIHEALLEKEKSTDPARWREARSWYIRANKAATEDPWPLMLNYVSYGTAHAAPPANAADGMLYAFALAPYAPDARYQAARVYLSRNDKAKARTNLLPIVYAAEGKKDADRARKVLALLDTQGGPAALAELDRQQEEDKAKSKSGKSGDD